MKEECNNCFEGKSDFDHVCSKCKGTGYNTPKSAPVGEYAPVGILEKLSSVFGDSSGGFYSNFEWQSIKTLPPGTYKLYTSPVATQIAQDALDVIEALRHWIESVPKDVAAALPAMPGIDADWMDSVEDSLSKVIT